MSNPNVVDVLIKNVKTNQEQLALTEKQIDEIKESKKTIVDRLKEYQKDLTVMMKYADENQKKVIEELGFNLSETSRGLNSVATSAMDIIIKAKDNKMSNINLYNTYVKNLKKNEEAVNYTEFNIKWRPLFNNQRLLRAKSNDPKSSREDMISLNGKVMSSEEIENLTKKTASKDEKW